MNLIERQLRVQAVEHLACPTCGAQPGRPCRRKSTDWTGRRPPSKRAPLHPERLALAYRDRLNGGAVGGE
jgi:hypothetical protein